MNITNICVGLRTTEGNFSTTKFIEVNLQASTLLEVFQSGKYESTNIGRIGWLNLIEDSTLQPNCNKEGFNVFAGPVKVRLGILGNNKNDCNSPGSLLGFGTGGNSLCSEPVSISCGVLTMCNGNNHNEIKSMIGYIFIR